jgi:GNAT superfamily N-acetyltransferase
MPRKSPLTIRSAVIGDSALVLDFIRELADYENLLHEVVATVEDVEQWLFCDPPYAEVLIAEWTGEAAGFALFFSNFSTFLATPGIYLEDLYVRPQFRGHGIGLALLSRLAKFVVERGFKRLDWWVLHWNAPAIRFYEHFGAHAMDDWVPYRLEGDALKAIAAAGNAD